MSSRILSLDKENFVKRSGLTRPATFLISTFFVRAACWSHRVLVSTCLSLPRPCRDVIPMAAELSVHKRIGTCTPRSAKRACWPSETAAPFTSPWNSASPEESVTLV